MEESFPTLTEAISAIFRKEQTSLLSLDRICDGLANPNLFIVQVNKERVPCSTISRRRISSILSSCDLFIRAGPPRSCMWALRPHNPLFMNESALSSYIEQILTGNGPLYVEEIMQKSDIPGLTEQLINNFLLSHTDDFSINSNGKIWFSNQPLPEQKHFDNVVSALIYAFTVFKREASIEEVCWILCFSTIDQKKITRRKISRELARRTDLFQHVSRAKYALINQNANPISAPQEIKSVPNKLPLPVMPQINFSFDMPSFDFDNDWTNPDFNNEMKEPTIMCETPPCAQKDFFDPDSFFVYGGFNSYPY